MLADWAEAINGKLYIQGGGWARVSLAAGPIRCALAIKLSVPWSDANSQHVLAIRLLDADGRVVALEGNPVEIEAAFEVGRPPGIVPGTPLDIMLAPSFLGLPLAPGRYQFTLEVDAQPLQAMATFEVV
jgi:hypothetical protein